MASRQSGFRNQLSALEMGKGEADRLAAKITSQMALLRLGKSEVL